MSTNRSIAIVTLGLAIAFVAVQQTTGQHDLFGQYEKRQDKASHKYCGRHLSDALQLLCNGVYNPMFKKNGQEMEIDDYKDYGYDYPMRSRVSANAMLGRFGGGRFRRESRGVHDECCLKSCTTSEMYSYCAH